jgi:hypothetical protein
MGNKIRVFLFVAVLDCELLMHDCPNRATSGGRAALFATSPRPAERTGAYL